MAISKHEEKKQLSEDNERRDLEKNNFVFPPAYSRGKRKIQFPIGMDSLGNMYLGDNVKYTEIKKFADYYDYR